VKRIVWTAQARADVRNLSKPAAMQVLSGLHRFAESGVGNVKTLQGQPELRLRAGDYRILFVWSDPDALEILRVRHRKDAYR
jgi:mRNA interferase RelE/StbE